MTDEQAAALPAEVAELRRKKRAAEHNTSRKRMTPTRDERHALDK